MADAKILFNVGTIFCYDCVQALRRFIGSMKGVVSIEVETDRIAVVHDPEKVSAGEITRLVTDSVEKLGYRVLGQEQAPYSSP